MPIKDLYCHGVGAGSCDRVLPDKVMATQYILKLFEDDAFMMEVLNVSPQSILYIDHQQLMKSLI